MAKDEIRDQLWTFNYKIGNAPKTGVVRARNEDSAYRVAVQYCTLKSLRPPAKVFPMILADETILPKEVEAEKVVA